MSDTYIFLFAPDVCI